MNWKKIELILLIISGFAVYFAECGLINSDRSSFRQMAPERLQKRPFCNAFTGCGRKRSSNQDIEHELPSSNGMEDSLGDLLDLNSEPAVEDLMRQIMSQAKMWEAIQEANREMKNERNFQNRPKFPSIAFNSQK
ncbi:cardioactive peptide [Bradysia coprophila]|uniref:cardioactive peptide n=1 Tax=Bradysia coprophila TaxID=38358 RepID=UPI00187DC372|nr:cardioactive peptide [Bradysia coprophila]